MSKKRKRLALFVVQADEDLQKRFITGFTRQAFRINQDVCVFSMYKKYQDTAERDKGESNIFTLANPDFFDGIVILKDTIQTPNVAEELEKKLGECRYQEIISKAAVEQASRNLEIVNRDLRNNKDAVKLQKMGSTSGCQTAINICPVCNQKIQDSLLHIGQNVPDTRRADDGVSEILLGGATK